MTIQEPVNHQLNLATERGQLDFSHEEKTLYAEYVDDLKKRGFCKVDDSTSNQTRLLNRFTGDRLFPVFLESDYDRWCLIKKKTARFPGTRYLMKTLMHVVGEKFDPRGGEYSVDAQSCLSYVNTCKKYQPTSINIEIDPLWHEFWERLIADPVQRREALQWLAHCFQKPWERPSWHLMWPSDPGVGKGYLVEHILQPLLLHTEVAASYDKVMGRFSTMLETSLLVLLDDCKSSSDATQTKLKSILSEERQYVERKQQQGKMVPSYTRFILASNEARPLYLDPDERRWLVFDRLRHRVDASETQQFIAKLDAWVRSPGALDAIYNWFMGFDLTGFNFKHPPESEALKAMVALSVNPHEEFAAGYIEDNPIFMLADLQAAFIEDGLPRAHPSHVPHIMRKLGYQKSQIQIAGIGRNTYYYPMGMTKEHVQEHCKGSARVVQESPF
ncbi:primase-helicase family protein [Massilia sp. YMA4]|uniref:primase-helicase family protein n=1 Tax=Massilia sp. YMA4 TaxID=1593482 RepID=UPI00158342EE|nr:primase-helicase family protein [Massilia sp. YMA4]